MVTILLFSANESRELEVLCVTKDWVYVRWPLQGVYVVSLKTGHLYVSPHAKVPLSWRAKVEEVCEVHRLIVRASKTTRTFKSGLQDDLEAYKRMK